MNDPASAKNSAKQAGKRQADLLKGKVPRDASGKPLLTPEMIEELTPKISEIDRMRRKLMWIVSGCGTFLVLAILAMLYIPYWQMTGAAKETAQDFLEAAAKADHETAMALSGIRNEDYVRRQVEAFRAAIGEDGSFVVDGLDFVNAEPHDQSWVVGRILPATGPEVPFRLRVTWSSEHAGFAVYQGQIGDEPAQ